MARKASAYNDFVRTVQRALPKGAGFPDRARAMKAAGKAWSSGSRSASSVVASLGLAGGAPAGGGGALVRRTNPIQVRTVRPAARRVGVRRNPKGATMSSVAAVIGGALAGRYGGKLIPAGATAKLPAQAQQALPYALPAAGGVLGAQIGGEKISGAIETATHALFGLVGDFVSRTLFKPKTGA